jgi:hypothetical protein
MFCRLVHTRLEDVSDANENLGIMACYAVSNDKYLQTFRRIVMCQFPRTSSQRRCKHYDTSKRP